VAIAIAILAARPQATPGPAARDFEAYWSAGAAWNAHADPYSAGIWTFERAVPGVDPRRYELLPFVGPPPALPAWSLFARLPYGAATALWLSLIGAAIVALALTAARGSGAPPNVATTLGAIALALSFGPVTSDFALGQLALPAFLGATLLAAGTAPLSGATIYALLAYAQPNVALGLLSQLGRNRATLAMIAGALATYALGAIAAGPMWPVLYARALAAHAGAERFAAIQLTPAAIAYGFGAPPPIAQVAGFAFAVAALTAGIALTVMLRERFARFAACSALVPFVSSFAHEHDLVVAYAAALWCALRTQGVTRAIALVGTILVSVDWLGLAQRPTGVGQSALLLAAALAAFVALGPIAVRATMGVRTVAITAVLILAVFVSGALLGAAHPAPVWPDAMHSFAPPPGAAAATLWLAEQRATGLLAAVPAWALLRALSLGGCALLVYAIYRRSSCCRMA
jgi:hypothetical protein